MFLAANTDTSLVSFFISSSFSIINVSYAASRSFLFIERLADINKLMSGWKEGMERDVGEREEGKGQRGKG